VQNVIRHIKEGVAFKLAAHGHRDGDLGKRPTNAWGSVSLVFENFELVGACSPTRVADLLDIATENLARSDEVTFVRAQAILFLGVTPSTNGLASLSKSLEHCSLIAPGRRDGASPRL
jgi:hypothetical protein